jgi:hypothetical protein
MSAELNIPDIIKQLIAVDDVHLNDLREEHIQNLTPINNVSTGPSPSHDPKFSFYVGKETPKGAESSFDDMMTVIISEELYPLYIELDEVAFKTKFNQIIYSHISKKLEEAREKNVPDTDNIWMQPNTTFINWFHENGIEIDEVESSNEGLKNEIQDVYSYYLKKGCSETQIRYVILFKLTEDYLNNNNNQEMSIRKAIIIVYNQNKNYFPEWADGSLNKYYHLGQNISINL